MAVPKTGGKRAEQFLSVTATKSSRSTQNWNTRSKKIAPTKNSIANTVRSEKTFKMSTLVFLSLFFDSQCSFNRTPLNAVRRIGEQVTMGCGTSGCSGTGEYCDHPCENIVWVRYIPNSSDMDHILIFNTVSHVFSDHISLVDQSNGNCDLEIQVQSSADAGTYECINLSTWERASAELVVMGSSPECDKESTEMSCIVTCFLKFTGNWAPTIEWTPVNGREGANISATESVRVSEDEVRITVTFPLIETSDEREIIHYKCVVKFTKHGRPDWTTAENIPYYRSISFGAV